jgi:hypothetical protein
MISLKNLFYTIWELPQNILGYIMSRIWINNLKDAPKHELSEVYELEKTHNVKIYIISRDYHIKTKPIKYLSGFSLGRYICLDSLHTKKTIKHEIGHSYQSRLLGPLYLPIVGISSAIFCNLCDRIFHKKWTTTKRYTWYYNRFPENWADRLGGV